MDKDECLRRLVACGVISVIRARSPEEAIRIGKAVYVGGIEFVEVSMVTPDAFEAIRALAKDLGGDVVVGAGTVLDAQSAREAILAGAEFVVGPSINKSAIELCRRYSKVVIPGAFTPTEILTAWELGADIVKVFPASVGGPRYIRDILEPLPQLRLLPTGGVNLDNVAEFIRAGSVAVAVGSALIDRKAVEEGRLSMITDNARRFIEAVRNARSKHMSK
ncbi:MAG: bifunctional 4-hydroxy-2-oxoglutarate aldolase/2-dehydro-3-deoxy-phosphogluconate aldolase [Candidatus Bathyarchaeia archaeon]